MGVVSPVMSFCYVLLCKSAHTIIGVNDSEIPTSDMKSGLLAAGFDFGAAAEDEFNDWYDTEHIPERRGIRGFLSAQRWIGAQDPKISIALYDLESAGVLQSPAYRAIAGANLSPWSKRMIGKCRRLLRFEGEQILPDGRAPDIDSAAMLLFGMNVAPEAEQEFNAWYDEEHIPRLSAVPGCLGARRFRSSGGSPRYLALYHLSSSEVVSTKTWEDAALTPWTLKLRPHTSDRLRIVLRRYQAAAR